MNSNRRVFVKFGILTMVVVSSNKLSEIAVRFYKFLTENGELGAVEIFARDEANGAFFVVGIALLAFFVGGLFGVLVRYLVRTYLFDPQMKQFAIVSNPVGYQFMLTFLELDELGGPVGKKDEN